MASYLYHFRVSLQHGSAADGVFTFSMNSHGIPSWVIIVHASQHSPQGSMGLQIGNISISDASIVYMSMGGCWSNSTAIASGGTSIPLASLPATVTFPFNVYALIASR